MMLLNRNLVLTSRKSFTHQGLSLLNEYKNQQIQYSLSTHIICNFLKNKELQLGSCPVQFIDSML